MQTRTWPTVNRTYAVADSRQDSRSGPWHCGAGLPRSSSRAGRRRCTQAQGQGMSSGSPHTSIASR
jgi:hypothetical protein